MYSTDTIPLIIGNHGVSSSNSYRNEVPLTYYNMYFVCAQVSTPLGIELNMSYMYKLIINPRKQCNQQPFMKQHIPFCTSDLWLLSSIVITKLIVL